MHSRRSNGFTLVELMITVAVLAVLVAVGYPNLQSVIRSNRAVAANNEALGLIALARSEAVRSNGGGGVCGSTDGSACDGNWAGGLLAFADTNRDGDYDAGETILRYSMGNPRLQAIGPTTAAISFDGRGRRRAAAEQTIVLRPDNCNGQPMQRTISINASGQARSTTGACQ